MVLINDVIAPRKEDNSFKKRLVRLTRLRLKKIWSVAYAHWKPAVTLLIVIGLMITLGLIISSRKVSVFPENVKKQAAFTILYPADNTESITPKRTSLVYDKANHGLSYEVTIYSTKVVVSEQRVPEIFDEKGVYTYKLDQARQYANFDSRFGEVNLTHPKDLQGQTLAWLKTKDTLILARSFGDLSPSQWQAFFDSLAAVN